MRALSLTEPWAVLVAIGAKKFETRGWRVFYRGQLAIHASKMFPAWAKSLCDREWCKRRGASTEQDFAVADALAEAGLTVAALPLGAIVGVVDVLDCVPTTDVLPTVTAREQGLGDYAKGRFAIRLANPRHLPDPIPWSGRLGIWDVPDDVEAEIRRQVG